MNERLSAGRIYDVISTTLEGQLDREAYIRNELIPKMAKRRDRTEPMSRDEIETKIFSVRSDKKGEALEFFEESAYKSRWRLTPEFALEMADIIYYTHQPNAPEWLNNPAPLINSMGITLFMAYGFCIVKYETRLICGDASNYKEVERGVMELFLKDNNTLNKSVRSI